MTTRDVAELVADALQGAFPKCFADFQKAVDIIEEEIRVQQAIVSFGCQDKTVFEIDPRDMP